MNFVTDDADPTEGTRGVVEERAEGRAASAEAEAASSDTGSGEPDVKTGEEPLVDAEYEQELKTIYAQSDPEQSVAELRAEFGPEYENLLNLASGFTRIEGFAEARHVLDVAGVAETAAVAIPPPGGGPDRLVVYAVAAPGSSVDVARLRSEMQRQIRAHLNPLFKIHDVVLIDSLPRTASAKVMRRSLRSEYTES